MTIVGKYGIEINFVGDGRTFVNFWDYAHGNDVIVEIIDGELELTEHNADGAESYRKISFIEYVELVKESINKRNI